MSNPAHFTSFILKFNFIDNFSFGFEKNKVCCHGGVKNNGKFLKCNGFTEMFKKNKNLVPYIFN